MSIPLELKANTKMARLLVSSLILALVQACIASAQENLRLPVTRDTWFSNVGEEADGNNGGAPQMKVKSHQEMSLTDINPAPLKGRVIRSATLHLHSSSPAKLLRVTVGGMGAEWFEGTGTSYAKQAGSSTFNSAKHPSLRWTLAGGDLCSVILGNGGTTWAMSDATPVDPQGWQTVKISPKVLATRVAGLSHGLFLYDDTGSEWKREGEKFVSIHMPNRYVHSKDQNRSVAPYVTVALGERDNTPPLPVTNLRTEVAELPAGEALIRWTTPADRGASGTLGFFATVDGREVPRYQIPLAAASGSEVRLHLRDMNIKAGALINLSVKPVDAAGNVGQPSVLSLRVSSRTALALPEGTRPLKTTVEQSAIASLPRVAGKDVAVIDELDKLEVDGSTLIPAQPPGYFGSNHVWNAATRQITLHAAKNEFVGTQIVVLKGGLNLRPSMRFEPGPGALIQAQFGRFESVASKRGPLPDPIVPIVEGESTSTPLHVEFYVPHEVSAGEHRGKMRLEVGGESLELSVVVRVWNFTLPDHLSFIPEMNCYGLPSNERDYYRLAHRHRTYLNRVPYSQRGEVADGCAPVWNGKALDWSKWDRRFGGYFDGSAFSDLPRKGVPIEGFYLPIHENWPNRIDRNYNNGYWADESLKSAYRRDLVEVSRQFAEHLNDRGWNDTFFQLFLNGKNDFKRNGWSRGSSPWILDEPSSFQDFWALRYFGLAFHEGAQRAPGKAKIVFRADISRPQWQRDTLDGLLDYNVVGGAFRKYREIVLDRKAQEGQFLIEYGSANAVEESNYQPVGWSIDTWALGSDGVLPWQTVGTDQSWKQADTLSLFYPRRPGRNEEPVASVRLKAFRRGQQDVEYLTWLAIINKQPRWAVGESVRQALKLAGERGVSGFNGGEDAGVIRFSRLGPGELAELRRRVGKAISDAQPPPRKKLIEFRTPPRTPSNAPTREWMAADVK